MSPYLPPPGTYDRAQRQAQIPPPRKPEPSMDGEDLSGEAQFRASNLLTHERTKKLRMFMKENPEAYKVIPARKEAFRNISSKVEDVGSAARIRTYHKKMSQLHQQRISSIQASAYSSPSAPALITPLPSASPSSVSTCSRPNVQVQVRELPSSGLPDAVTTISSSSPSPLPQGSSSVVFGRNLRPDYTSSVEVPAATITTSLAYSPAEVQVQEDEQFSTSSCSEETLVNWADP